MYLRLALLAALSVAAGATAQPQDGRPHPMSLLDPRSTHAARRSA
jgi:hypothetical protein